MEHFGSGRSGPRFHKGSKAGSMKEVTTAWTVHDRVEKRTAYNSVTCLSVDVPLQVGAL